VGQVANVIYIFEENQRFSEKTPHPGPRHVVGAANLAADLRHKQPREQNRLPQCVVSSLPNDFGPV
jgi:hypothetical protein